MKRAAALAAALVALVPLAGAAQPAPTEVTYVTGSPTNGDWPTFIAQRQGFFKDDGLTVSLVYAGTPPSVTQAVATNAANIGSNGNDSWIVAIANHLPLRIVGTMFAVNPFTVVTSPEIKGWDDLKGKSVMLGTKQDVTAIVLAQLAAPHGLKLDDFSIVIGGNSGARYAALSSGNAQAAVLTQPFDILAQSKGMKILASAVDTMKDWPLSSLAVNPAWASTHRATVVKFMHAIRRAMQYGYTHKAEAVADLIAETHVDPAIAQRAYDDNWTRWHAFDPDMKFTPAHLQYIGRLQVGMGIMSAVPAYADVADPSYATEMAR